MKIAQILLLLLLTSNLYSQREYYNWYVGYGTNYTNVEVKTFGLLFDDTTNFPIPISNGKMDTHNSSPISISDKKGNFLFKADLNFLRDKNYDTVFNMKNEFQNQKKSIFINNSPFCITDLNNKDLHYLFYINGNYLTKNVPSWININDFGINYWVYDSKNKSIINTNNKLKVETTDCIEITLNNNNNEYWVLISKHISNELVSYKFDNDGIDSLNPIINFTSDEIYSLSPIDIKVSPNRKKIAIVYFDKEINNVNKLLLADFDDKTGKISNFAISNVDYKAKKFYDVRYLLSRSLEFSPNSKKLYLGAYKQYFNFDEEYLIQYNLDSLSNENNIKNYNIIETETLDLGVTDFELAPNGTIICNERNRRNVSVINNPNDNYNDLKFSKINFELKDSVIYGYTGDYLPKTLSCKYSFLKINHFQEICENYDLELKATPFYDLPSASFTWQGPKGFYSIEKTPIIKNISKSQEGYYNVMVYNDSDTLTDSTLVNINEVIDFEIIKSKEKLCNSDSLILFTNENYDLLWNNLISSKSFTVYNSGTYTASFIDNNKCVSTKIIYIKPLELFSNIISSQNNFCHGDSAMLSLDKNYDNIIWNTGETTKDIIVKESGVYSATVTEGECINDTNIVINVNPLPTLDIESPNGTILCDGGSIILEAKVPANTSIVWNDGTKLAKRTVSISGTYTLTAEDLTTGCKNTKSIVVSDIENLKAEIQGEPTFCDGESTTLTIQPQGKSYLWSNGETTQSIVVNNSGNYSATITTDTDCKIDAEIEVIKNPLPTFQLLGETIICNNSTTIYPDKDFKYYQWSNGETSKSITIDKAGNYDLTVTDDIGCQSTKSIKITESTPEINLSNRNIDFGELLFGNSKSEDITTDKDIIFIKNSSNFDVNYQDKNINILFNPKDIGEFKDTLIIESIGDCKALDTIYIQGICKAEILAKVSNSEGYPGDKVINTVNLELIQDIPLPKDFNYEIDIQINQDAISIIDATTFNYKNNKLEINIAEYLNKTSYDEEVKNINSKILLAKNLENELLITYFTTDNPYLIPIRQNGNIKIFEVCLYEERLIQYYNEAIISNITQTNTRLSTFYTGKYTIEITDISGKTTTKEVTTTSDNEEINFNYKLSNGTYIIKITEPGKTQTRKIIFGE